MRTTIIIPSILPIKESHKDMQKEIRRLEPHFVSVHVDIMDKEFIGHLSFTPQEINALRTSLHQQVHLMVAHPRMWISKFVRAKRYFIHVEIDEDIPRLLRDIRRMHVKTGIALNPETPIEKTYPYLKKARAVLIMSVRPGKSGQRFMPGALKKIKALRRRDRNIRIIVDGGVNLKNLRSIMDAGATHVVMGNALFGAPSIEGLIRKAREVEQC